MQINGPSNVHGPHSVNAPSSVRPTEQATQPNQAGGADEVSISQEADFLSRVDDIPDIRQDRVDQIQAEIARGAYETDEKIDIAVSRLLDEIG
ncbi:MAG: flagellar biosynthesis anti-sigma factor FlgM [Planctomycetales bacterium]